MDALYGLLLVAHIASIAIAFGAIVVAPLLARSVDARAPGSVAALTRAQRLLGDTLIAPAGTLALITGAALATLGDYWGELWVSLPLSLLVFVLALHGAYVSPAQRRLEALAANGDEAPSGGVAKRLAAAHWASSAAIVVALALMVLKPS